MYNQMDLETGPAGARDLIRECHEMLAGQRARWTPLSKYLAGRRRYWRARLAAAQPTSKDERAA